MKGPQMTTPDARAQSLTLVNTGDLQALQAIAGEFISGEVELLANIDDLAALTGDVREGVNKQSIAEAVGEAAIDFALLTKQGRRKKLLISDMDSTIIEQECLDELADFAGLKAEISAITERAMRGELNFESALTERVGMLKGLGLDKLQACFDERITLTPGAKTFVETMKANGAYCLLVSGGFTYFTDKVGAAAGFHADQGNTLIDDGETLTGAVGMPILGREAKQTALETALAEHGLVASDAVAIGDGANDLAMITAAGLGIAFEAKPIVASEADCAINHTDLRTALLFQGYRNDEFVSC